jgi:hypothetical protein
MTVEPGWVPPEVDTTKANVFLVAVLHFIPDTGQAAEIVATLRDALAPGSYLVICHACRDEQPGLVWIPEWRPDSPGDVPADPSKYWALVGVGRYNGPPSPL